jgi:hypothetical protein
VSRLDDLQRAQEVMWSSITAADPDKRAPLMNQWRALEASIAELKSQSGKTGDPVDEIAARRSARGGGTARLGRAAGGAG